MNKSARLNLAILCGILASSGPAQAVVVGVADSSNSYPFGSVGGGPYFQQVYSAASFGSALNINRLTFYNSLSPSTNTPLNDTFTIFLSTTSAAIATFDTSPFAFPDASFTQVFSGKLSTLVNGRLEIPLATTFNYNPSAGNLMLTVRDFDFGSGGNLFLDSDRNVGVTNIRISAFSFDFNQGLVTGFNDVSTVPEPRTWAMMIAGFGLTGGAMRRRRARKVSLADA